MKGVFACCAATTSALNSTRLLSMLNTLHADMSVHGDLMVNALWLYGYDAPRSIVIVCLILLRILLHIFR
eukprot:1593262-Amphidinium_carterae.2